VTTEVTGVTTETATSTGVHTIEGNTDPNEGTMGVATEGTTGLTTAVTNVEGGIVVTNN
jgi:hypothetical protein